jgi:cytoskeletal protein CcmA (bactofilin family)
MFRRGEGDDRHDQHEQRDRHGPIRSSEVQVRDQPPAGSEVTVVGKGARIEGNLISAGSLRIDGQVKGKITAEGDVSLSPQSDVQADIEARNVVVGGAFTGNIVAASRAELAKGGRVDGNVTSKVLVVAEGAVFTGQSIMDGPRPSSPARAADSAASPAASEANGGSEAKPPERAVSR